MHSVQALLFKGQLYIDPVFLDVIVSLLSEKQN